MHGPGQAAHEVNTMAPRASFLIVDDEPVVRLALTRVLSSDRCDVETAADGPEALQRLQERAFDVVLLDLRMPGMDGLTVLRTIKSRWPASEVIIVTGHAGLQSAKESVALGAFDYLAKPVGPNDLIHATREALRHKAWAMRPAAPAPASTLH
jgi:CheY-like chemotaxis protein